MTTKVPAVKYLLITICPNQEQAVLRGTYKKAAASFCCLRRLRRSVVALTT